MGKNDVPVMLEKVIAQIKAIKRGLPDKENTTTELPGFGKIKDIKSLSVLIQAHSMVTKKSEAFKESAKILIPEGTKAPSFTLAGHSEASWIEDIKARTVIVIHETRLNQLNRIKDKLEANLSDEAKLAKDLADIQAIAMEDF